MSTSISAKRMTDPPRALGEGAGAARRFGVQLHTAVGRRTPASTRRSPLSVRKVSRRVVISTTARTNFSSLLRSGSLRRGPGSEMAVGIFSTLALGAGLA